MSEQSLSNTCFPCKTFLGLGTLDITQHYTFEKDAILNSDQQKAQKCGKGVTK